MYSLIAGYFYQTSFLYRGTTIDYLHDPIIKILFLAYLNSIKIIFLIIILDSIY